MSFNGRYALCCQCQGSFEARVCGLRQMITGGKGLTRLLLTLFPVNVFISADNPDSHYLIK